MDNRDTLIWLNSLGIMSNTTISNLEKYYGDIRNIWDSSSIEIQSLSFISEKNKQLIINNLNEEYYYNYIDKIKKLQIEVITVYDKEYPQSLREIFSPPKVLYVKGSIIERDNIAIGIVGSRKATGYGKWAAEKFSKELTNLGVTVVSGMASGIDTKAHWGSINSNGRTLAILGSGLNVIYPKSNRELFNKIPQNGAIISEFPLNTQPLAYNFPQRNRIISGLSLGIVVIEAAKKSGSLITAHYAIDQGKEVFALPGNINSIYSRGTNLLIKDGAKPLMSIEDIIEEIDELKSRLDNKNRMSIDKNMSIDLDKFSEIERRVLTCLIEKPIHCDMVAINCNISINDAYSVLTILEMKGIVNQLPGKMFALY